MKGAVNKVFASKFWWLLLLAGLFVINFLASQFHARFDLTKEKRYTLSKATRNLVKGLEDDVQIDVFLKGEFPSGFRKLANTTKEFLGLLKDMFTSFDLGRGENKRFVVYRGTERIYMECQ